MWYVDVKPSTTAAILLPRGKLAKVRADTERTEPREYQEMEPEPARPKAYPALDFIII